MDNSDSDTSLELIETDDRDEDYVISKNDIQNQKDDEEDDENVDNLQESNKVKLIFSQ